MRLRRLAVRHRLVGIFVFQLVEGEAAGVGDLDGAVKRVFVAGEEPRHFLRRLQVPLGIGFELQPSVWMVHFSRMQVSTSCKGRRCAAW